MAHYGLYESLIEQALTDLHPAPWSAHDLEQCKSSITAEHCQTVYPHCRPQDVVDWLHKLSPADRQGLVRHLNTEQAARDAGRQTDTAE